MAKSQQPQGKASPPPPPGRPAVVPDQVQSEVLALSPKEVKAATKLGIDGMALVFARRKYVQLRQCDRVLLRSLIQNGLIVDNLTAAGRSAAGAYFKLRRAGARADDAVKDETVARWINIAGEEQPSTLSPSADEAFAEQLDEWEAGDGALFAPPPADQAEQDPGQ